VYKKEQDAVVASCQALGGVAPSLKLGAPRAAPPRATNCEMSFHNGDFFSKVDPQWLSAPASQPACLDFAALECPSGAYPVHVLRAAAANATGVPSREEHNICGYIARGRTTLRYYIMQCQQDLASIAQARWSPNRCVALRSSHTTT